MISFCFYDFSRKREREKEREREGEKEREGEEPLSFMNLNSKRGTG